MKFKNITETWLKNFAEDKIYERACIYSESGMVYSLEYDPDNARIQANVSGNYGNYYITISEGKKEIQAACDCPYNGYPCKHIIAVLLNFIQQKARYVKQAQNHKILFNKLEIKLQKLKKKELIKVIIDGAHNYPDFRRELMSMLQPDNAETLQEYLKHIQDFDIDDFEDDYNSELKQIREFRKILKSAEKSSPQNQSRIYWAVADKILKFLNKYGVSDENWENLVCQIFEHLSILLKNNKSLDSDRRELIDKLIYYYNLGNSGLIDDIDELIENLKDDE